MQTTLAADPGAVSTTWTVADGSLVGANGADKRIRLRCENEIVLCTQRSDNDLTVMRGLNNTAAAGHPIGAQVTLIGWALSEVEAMVDRFYSICPVDGIYFDEGPANYAWPVDATVITFYRTLYSYVQTKSGGAGTQVMLNAAGTEATNQWVLDPTTRAADIVQLVEPYALSDPTRPSEKIGYLDSQFTLPPWATNGTYPRNRIHHTIHDCPQANLAQAVTKSCQLGAGYVYVFDGSASQYDRVPGPVPPPRSTGSMKKRTRRTPTATINIPGRTVTAAGYAVSSCARAARWRS